MRQKIKNTLAVEVEGIDLTTVRNIEFYIRQGDIFYEYTPTVLNSSEMIVIIPKDHADALRYDMVCSLQFAFTDPDGNHIASEIVKDYVDRLLKSEGYDGD